MSSRKSLASLELISRLKQFPKTTVVGSQNVFTGLSSSAYSKYNACSPINALLSRQLSSGLTWNADKFNCETHLCNCKVSSIKRDLSSCTPHVLQKDPGNRSGNHKSGSGDTDIKSETQNTQLKVEEAYDPKKDRFFTQDTAYGSKGNKGGGESERPVFIPPEEDKESSEDSSEDPPTNCCMSGCHNCVWIEYVEKLTKKYSDPRMGRDKVLKELEELQDDNIKAFIMMELRIRKLI